MVPSMGQSSSSQEKELVIRELENSVESGCAESLLLVLCHGLLCKQPLDTDTGKICY